jgi:hypothetical protein
LEGFWQQSKVICGFEGVARRSEITPRETWFGQEWAAKAYFALTRRLKGKATPDELSTLMPQFGWSVDKAEMEKASAFLERANFVSQQ